MMDKKVAPTAPTADASTKPHGTQNQKDPCNPNLPHPKQNYNQKLMEFPLLAYIPTGRGSAITAKRLTKISGYKDARSLQMDVHRMRLAGIPVLSATDEPCGYFMPETPEEAGRFIASMTSRIRNTRDAMTAAERYRLPY